MRIKKNLIQLVESNYTPLQTNQEGLLRGGFGAMTAVVNSLNIHANIIKNPTCKNGEYPNPECTITCTVINYCPSTSPSPSPSPSPAMVGSFLGFLTEKLKS